MRQSSLRCVLPLLLALAVAPPQAARAQSPLPASTPEAEGFAPDRLSRLDARLKEIVDTGQYAGLVTLVARDGRIVDWQAWGSRDRERNLPMERDTIVRIYSMSKILTTVAVMQLHEQARLKLDDPVEKYLPDFAKPKVFVGGTARKPVLVAAKRAVTIKDLLTHTSGYRYWNMYSKGALDDLYAAAKVEDATSLDDAMARVAKLPLAFQPGDRFAYGIGLDILGAVVQKISGQPFADYVAEHICAPLKMVDTGYSVPPAKRDRLAEGVQDRQDGRARAGGEARDVVARRHRAVGRRGHVLHDRRLRALRADAAERRGTRRRPHPRPQDRGADGSQPPQSHDAADDAVERVGRVRARRCRADRISRRETSWARWGSSGGAARRRPTSTSIRRSARWCCSSRSTSRTTSTTCSSSSRRCSTRRS